MKLNMKIMVRFQIQVFSSYEIISLKIVRIQKNVTLKWMVLIKYCITSNIIFVATSLIFYYIGVFPFSLPFLNCRFKAGFILNSIFFFFFFEPECAPGLLEGKGRGWWYIVDGIWWNIISGPCSLYEIFQISSLPTSGLCPIPTGRWYQLNKMFFSCLMCTPWAFSMIRENMSWCALKVSTHHEGHFHYIPFWKENK